MARLSKGKALPIILAIFLFIVLIFLSFWSFSPTFREKVLLGLLISGIPPLQRVVAKELKNYPTQLTAISLILFTNLKVSLSLTRSQREQLAIERCKEKQDESKICWQKEFQNLENQEIKKFKKRTRNNQLAEESLKSLCKLTGHSFGSFYEETKFGFSWGKISEKKWPSVLGDLNIWAARTFGPLVLNSMEKLIPEFQDEFNKNN